MGEAKKIDIPALAAACKKFYPELKAAANLEQSKIAGVMSETEFTPFSTIKRAASCSVSAACNFLTEAVRHGVAEKDPAMPLYRLSNYDAIREKSRSLLHGSAGVGPLKHAERLIFAVVRYANIFDALQGGELSLSEIQEATGYRQSTASLKMARLYEYWWLDCRREGRNVYYLLSDHARMVLSELSVLL